MWGVRFPEDLRARIDSYADREGLKRAEAIRRLVEKGLTSE